MQTPLVLGSKNATDCWSAECKTDRTVCWHVDKSYFFFNLYQFMGWDKLHQFEVGCDESATQEMACDMMNENESNVTGR